MSNSAPPLASPPEGETEVSIEPETSPAEIINAAEQGRVAIRPQDLSVEVMNALSSKFGAKFIEDKFSELLKATKTMAVGGAPYETPDFKTQLDALKLLLQYQVGMPVARSEVITHNVDTVQTLEAKIQKSPALRRAVGRMVDRAKAEEGEVIDVPAEETQPGDVEEAEEVLQALPPQEETPIEREVNSRSMADKLGRVDKRSIEEKWG